MNMVLSYGYEIARMDDLRFTYMTNSSRRYE